MPTCLESTPIHFCAFVTVAEHSPKHDLLVLLVHKQHVLESRQISQLQRDAAHDRFQRSYRALRRCLLAMYRSNPCLRLSTSRNILLEKTRGNTKAGKQQRLQPRLNLCQRRALTLMTSSMRHARKIGTHQVLLLSATCSPGLPDIMECRLARFSPSTNLRIYAIAVY